MRKLIDNIENQFYSPFTGQVLIKAEEQGGKWVVYLQASNEGLDQESEVILHKALHDARDYYLSHGILSWDHKHKVTHLPKFIIGEPEDVAFTGDKTTLVKGFLYKENEVAQQVWKNIRSGATKLGASVGGGILKKGDSDDPKVNGIIGRVIWDETAITHKPVNDGTLGHVQLIPFPEFVKALTAGAGVDAAQYTGGRALTGENLDNELKDLTFGQTDVKTIKMPYEETRRYFDGVVSGIFKGSIKSMNDVVDYTLDQGYSDGVAGSLIDFVAQKIPKLK